MEGKNIIEALENIDEALDGTAGDAINIVDALNQIAESLKNKSGNNEAIGGGSNVMVVHETYDEVNIISTLNKTLKEIKDAFENGTTIIKHGGDISFQSGDQYFCNSPDRINELIANNPNSDYDYSYSYECVIGIQHNCNYNNGELYEWYTVNFNNNSYVAYGENEYPYTDRS